MVLEKILYKQVKTIVTGINNSAFPDFQTGFANGIGCACGVKDSALVMEGSYESPSMSGMEFEDKILLIGNYDNYFDDDDFFLLIGLGDDITGININGIADPDKGIYRRGIDIIFNLAEKAFRYGSLLSDDF